MIDLKRDLILDGAMGTLIYEREGLPAGFAVERLNIERSETVARIHEEYLAAGADVVSSNTFGANPLKSADFAELIRAGLKLARSAGRPHFTAFDVGPCGKMLGDGISFDECVAVFRRVFEAGGDQADFIYLETFTDLRELRAAILAARETSSLPIVASMTFGTGLRTPFGNPVDCFAHTALAAGAAAVGANCSLGPSGMTEAAKALTALTDAPVFIKPNAGMPVYKGGKTVYDVGAEAFAAACAEFRRAGVNAVGGCCGTSPAYIAALREKLSGLPSGERPQPAGGAVCSATKCVTTGSEMKIVGERINPTGKKKFREALLCGDYDYAAACGIEQEKAGADILDVNVGVNGLDEASVLAEVSERLARVVDAPLQFDSSDGRALEAVLRRYCGKAIVNSVNATKESLQTILPIAARYGAAVVALPIDENGIPSDVEGRMKNIKAIVEACGKHGIGERDIFVDALTLAEASVRGAARVTLDTLSEAAALGVGSILGISNVSFGMPCRSDVNAAFLELAKRRGLSLAIINPALLKVTPSEEAFDFLSGREGAAERYLAYAAGRENSEPQFTAVVTDDLRHAVKTGQKELAAKLASRLVETANAMEIAAEYIIPALDEVGDGYEKGVVFLPALIGAADAAKAAFDALLSVSPQPESDRRFVIASVKGDVHDIGKNIVAAVASNYGFRVIDLGKDVGVDAVLAAVGEHFPCVLGLSALMTTTVANMAETIAQVKKKFDIPILVGGAVLTEEYAKSIGGIYCADAGAAVRRLKELFGDRK